MPIDPSRETFLMSAFLKERFFVFFLGNLSPFESIPITILFLLLARYLEITPSPQPRSKTLPSFGRFLSISSNGRIAFLKKSYKTIYLILRIILAGTPPTNVLAGTFFVTTLPAATKDSLPTITPGKIIEPAPITDPLLKTTGLENLGKYLCMR